ncbi:SGT1-domain-containing protein [Mollisia scopiformis]|uniref:SGT1-domain-containing protein n=1 Tax=Mollisia scopiformis TaxID=149040 RepID=A0A194WSH3_MOLSC|nr:SGT1-domain-containing protein [Mollisia scopiformis]KUJ10634.1 SGT1-domain-containing protein [Mollisia scopiformis]
MDSQDDGLKWFGEGFDGFPKRLPEDCVEYTLFIIDSRLKNQKEVLSRLEAVRKESLKLTESLLKDYIWQRDKFKLELESGKGLMYLHGLTNYGDSVEDEWLIVYILRELSNHFPDLWIKVVDTDGEFLLIEAANALPRWLNPEIADNRVWIHHNQLRIIPLTAASSSSTTDQTAPISRSLTIQEACQIITSTPDILMNSPLIEEEAFYRLRNYPDQIQASMHHALITIPRKLASILHDRPTSIAPATEAFYLRDPIALKPLQTESSELIFPPKDLVTVSTRFTKVLYAQLKSQQFECPVAWRDILLQTAKETGESGKRYVSLEMGMKVTSGFEMLVTDSKNNDNRVVRELKILLDDLATWEDSDLPSDQDISKWKDVTREDDESWLDINFEDFERELQGKSQDKKKSGVPGSFGPEPPSGFGDAKTQADLKKMVERFESFLNDDNAGIDGAEMDDMDFDDDEDEEEDEEDSEDEDKDVSFDEKEFARMMREMMGMPPEEDEAEDPASGLRKVEEVESSDDEDGLSEARKIRKVMERMEAELNEAGALNLDPTPRKLSALKGKSKEEAEEDADSEDSDDDVNIDYNLAKNLLESFKSQAGMAGPGGNLLGLMGLQFPRDEDDTASTSKKT